MRIPRFFLLGLTLSATAAAWNVPAPGGGALSPGQAASIQAIGQAVLLAKKSATPDPDAQELRQGAEALAAVLAEAATIVPPVAGPQAAIVAQPPASPAKTQAAAHPDVTDSPKFRQRLDRFRILQAEVESHMLARARTKARLKHRPAYPILLQLRGMGEELDQALVAPAEERYRRLADLRRRLDAKPHISPSAHPGGQPPGLSTLARHYRNEQAEPAPASPRP